MRTWPIVGLLGGWSLWIVVHAPLSHLLGFSAWKLGGMGMFADHGDWLDGSVYVAVVEADDAEQVERAVVERLRDDGLRHGAAMDHVFVEHLVRSEDRLVSRELPEGDAAHEGVLLWPRREVVRRLLSVVPGRFVVRVVSGWEDGQTFDVCTYGPDGSLVRCVSVRR